MRFHFRILALFSTLLILQGCWSNYSWNQKITIVIDTPDGIKTSSTITRVERESNFFIHYFFKDGSPPKYIYRQFGEAAFVELGGGKYLFALLPYSRRSGRLAGSLYRSNINWYTSMDDLVDLPPKTLSIEQYPMLVTFADIYDPETIKQVKPQDFEAVFGSGYKLAAITVQITEEKITKGQVEQVLGADFFNAKVAIHNAALSRGFNDAYFKSLLGKLSRSNFLRKKR